MKRTLTVLTAALFAAALAVPAFAQGDAAASPAAAASTAAPAEGGSSEMPMKKHHHKGHHKKAAEGAMGGEPAPAASPAQ